MVLLVVVTTMIMIININLNFAVQNSASICFSMTRSFWIIWDFGFKICIINMFQYDEELAFFGIMPDVIGDCCYEDYRDRYCSQSLYALS